ncbi:MAG: NAD(P)H-hydrate dehydratase [Flavobacteriales bacterium]|nr:NAD(P)H-hydrate dehydratase [Flavobacteriales bacterium]
MFKILNANQVKEADGFTIESEPISSFDLMERAATKAYKRIIKITSSFKKPTYAVFCGAGNNGGDGLVIARKLLADKKKVCVFTFKLGNTLSADYLCNLDLYKGDIVELSEENQVIELNQNTIIIDAIFGNGLSRPIEGYIKNVINQINAARKYCIAIDIPSGLFVEDNSTNEYTAVIKANYTLSFEFPKLSFLLPENEQYVGDWEIVPIGLSKDFIQQVECKNYLITRHDVQLIKKHRAHFSHKGSFGHALLLAGCTGKIGAAVLAAKAAMRSGLGLLTVQIPKSANDILQISVPEAMVLLDESDDFLSSTMPQYNYSAIGIGPGIGMQEETQNLLKHIIQEVKTPMVIDADALNILAQNKTWLAFLPKGSILTPHPGEFKRLAGEWSSDFERLNLQIEFANKYQIYLVLKGNFTSIATPDGRVFFNPTGNSGMATAGSGDTLTGIITGLLAQQYGAEQAAILGVYLHGLSGDMAAKKKGKESLIASDLIQYLPKAFKKLVT